MTITTQQVKWQYAGNGSTVTFAYPQVFFAPTDLLVILSTSSGLVSPQPVLNGMATYDYQVEGTLDSITGANIVFNNPPPGGDEVTILSNIPFTQNLTLIDNSKFPAASVNAAFDRLTLICLQLLEQLGRAIVAPAYDVNPVMALPPAATREHELAGFDGSGNVTVVTPGATP